MPMLTIRFRNIALFAHRRSSGLTVIFPKKDHVLLVNGLALLADRAPFRLVKNGEPMRSRTKVENPGRLVALNDLLTGQASLALRPDKELDQLAVRWELGGGELVVKDPELLEEFKYLADKQWSFAKTATGSQLTNRVDYVLEIVDVPHAIVDKENRSIIDIKPTKGDTLIEVQNTELDTESSLTHFEETGELIEFRHLYEFLQPDQGTTSVEGPLPKVEIKAVNDAIHTLTDSANFLRCEEPFCPVAQVTER